MESTQGPFSIVEVQDLPFNGTVVIDKGSYKEKSIFVSFFSSSHNPVEEANAVILAYQYIFGIVCI